MKKIIFAVIGLLVVIGILAGIKGLQIRAMMARAQERVPPPETITTAIVTSEEWEKTFSAVGTLVSVRGVMVAAELPGKVSKIHFESGAAVKKGDLILAQDTSEEEAELPGAVAQETLARSNRERAERMLSERIVSQADLDSAVAAHEEAVSRVKSLRASIDKKQIRAPFAGRLGIRLVNPGQYLESGQSIVALQTLDPIYVDFTLPQQTLSQLGTGHEVRIRTDALPGETLSGRITALDSEVDAATRAIKIRAEVENPGERLRPGMYVTVEVILPERPRVLSIPATAVLYAPYGDSVFVVEPDPKREGGLRVRQQFVRLGDRRGDFVSVTQGLAAGEKVVSTGVFKLRNGQAVVEDNRLAPDFKPSPRPENS